MAALSRGSLEVDGETSGIIEFREGGLEMDIILLCTPMQRMVKKSS
jgi:hypothetical protein